MTRKMMMVMIMTRPATCAEHSMVWPRCQRSSGRLPDAWDPALKVWGSDYSSDIWSPQHGIVLLFVFLRIWYNLRQNVLSVCKPFDFNVNACRLNHVTKNRQAMENHLKMILEIFCKIVELYLWLEVIGLNCKKDIFQLDSNWKQRKCQKKVTI